MLPLSGPTKVLQNALSFDGGSETNESHYKMHLRNHFVAKNGLQWKFMILY